MTTNDLIALARKHAAKGVMASSAQLCLSDAETLQAKGDTEAANVRALRSLSYSVGIMHADYQDASKAIDGKAVIRASVREIEASLGKARAVKDRPTVRRLKAQLRGLLVELV